METGEALLKAAIQKCRTLSEPEMCTVHCISLHVNIFFYYSILLYIYIGLKTLKFFIFAFWFKKPTASSRD
jgi:hypothetical protein